MVIGLHPPPGTIHVCPRASRKARFNLIYSHGRLEDITYRVLRHFLKCLARR